MVNDTQLVRSRRVRSLGALAGAALALSSMAVPPAAHADTPPYPSDTGKPDLVSILSGYDRFWQPSGSNDLHGTVLDATTLRRNDQLTAWINRNATADQQFRALQDSAYDSGGGYDQSVTISDALGSVLGPIYVRGRNSGALPLTSALVNSQNGSAGAYVSTGAAKEHYSYPRPFLAVDADAEAVVGDEDACSPARVNASSVKGLRVGQDYADANGDLAIARVPDVTDTTHAFSPNDVPLSVGYGARGLCSGGSFPSGHTTTAYQAGFTLATLLPELAPEILARASEAGNNRIVLGVHYPLDVMGGRMSGQAALAARWSDARFRTEVLEPARAELVTYLERECGAKLTRCIAGQKPYRDDPYAGRSLPGGSAQTVTDRATAATVYRERLTYGFSTVGATGRAPSVPAGAQNLLRTAFPTLTDAQRTSVLAQTEIGSGYPLDGTGTAAGSWQRLDLAAALSATVQVNASGSVTVLSTGGPARVVSAKTGVLRAAGATTVRAGGSVRLTGTGFAAGREVTLVLHGDSTAKLGTATADGTGRLAATVTVPRAAAVGEHAIDAVDDTGASVVVRPLSIRVAGVSPTTSAATAHPATAGSTTQAGAARAGRLPTTGTEIGTVVGLALLLMAAGGGFLLVRRVRGSADQSAA